MLLLTVHPLVEPCTQATGYLPAQRPNDSFALLSSCSLVSSLANPHCHLDQSSLQPDRRSGRYPAELHQPVFSPDGHLLSCEGHAYMSAISIDQTARTQDTAGDNDAFSDAADSLPHTMNTGMLVNELEDEVLSNQENDSCLELKPHLPFITEIKEPEGVVCAPKEFDKMTTETIASEILISDMLNRTVPLHDPWNVTDSALKNLIERKPGTLNLLMPLLSKKPQQKRPLQRKSIRHLWHPMHLAVSGQTKHRLAPYPEEMANIWLSHLQYPLIRLVRGISPWVHCTKDVKSVLK